ncbi:MAG: hypothetical protein LQ352_001718 [Teloschistes flavicans]|nr:MAG: hypothetical protein LQ352_001718 [Teloschistes flavicans]
MPSANRPAPPQSTKSPSSSSSSSSSSTPKPHESGELQNDSSDAVPASVQFAAEMRKRAPSITEPYVAYAVCEKLIKTCASQAEYSVPQRYEKGGVIPKTASGEDLGVGKGWWYEELGLTPTFTTWSQITFLHMYILHVRLRAFPASSAPTWHQHLLDHFFYTAEDRMVRDHNIAARGARNSYLKDLFVQWRGLLAGYDEGLVSGDAVLAAAVWRNVFKGDEGVDLRALAQVVSYTRGVVKGLEGMGDEEVARGDVVFGDPGSQKRGVVEVRSPMMDTLPVEGGEK